MFIEKDRKSAVAKEKAEKSKKKAIHRKGKR